MAERETLSTPGASTEWQRKAEALLDAYLVRVGVTSAPARARWIRRVIEDMGARAEEVPTEDLLEETIEHIWNLIEQRLAVVENRDPVRERRAIASTLVAVLSEKHRDVTNALLDRTEPGDDAETLERLRAACAASAPRPVPENAPLAMPVQPIELRSLNPFHRLFRRSR
jgi:hypothetical protein